MSLPLPLHGVRRVTSCVISAFRKAMSELRAVERLSPGLTRHPDIAELRGRMESALPLALQGQICVFELTCGSLRSTLRMLARNSGLQDDDIRRVADGLDKEHTIRAKSIPATKKNLAIMKEFYGEPLPLTRYEPMGIAGMCFLNALSMPYDMYIGALATPERIYPHAFCVDEGVVMETTPLPKKYAKNTELLRYFGKPTPKNITSLKQGAFPDCIRPI